MIKNELTTTKLKRENDLIDDDGLIPDYWLLEKGLHKTAAIA